MTLFLCIGLMLLGLAAAVYFDLHLRAYQGAQKKGISYDQNEYHGVVILWVVSLALFVIPAKYVLDTLFAKEVLSDFLYDAFPWFLAFFLISVGARLYTKYYPSSKEELEG